MNIEAEVSFSLLEIRNSITKKLSINASRNPEIPTRDVEACFDWLWGELDMDLLS